MKILILTQQYGLLWSGVGTYATSLVNGLADDKENEITVITYRERERQIHKNIILIEVPRYTFDPFTNHWVSLAYSFRKQIIRLIKKKSFDIIHFTDAREALFCPKIKNSFVIGTVHDTYSAESHLNPFYYKREYSDWFSRTIYYSLVKIIEPFSLRKIDHIISNSNYVTEKLADIYSLPLSLFSVIYIGVSNNYSGLNKKPDNLVQYEMGVKHSNDILFIGGNFQRKGLKYLLLALALLKKEGILLKLTIVGRDKNMLKMRELGSRLGISNEITFLGLKSNDEVMQMIPTYKLLVMPSLIEGFGLVYLEAMQAGVPVIGSKKGGTNELIQDGVNGFLVEPRDVETLSKKIKILISDKEIYDNMAIEAKIRADFFSINRMISETVNLYKSKKNANKKSGMSNQNINGFIAR